MLSSIACSLLIACQPVEPALGGSPASDDDAAPPDPGSDTTGEDDDPPARTDPEVDGDEGIFIPEIDAGGPIPECDPWDLDACGPGRKCTGYAPDGGSLWSATRCVPIVDESGGIGEPCTYDGPVTDGFDDCEGGAVCWDIMLLSGKDVGTCVPICVGSQQEPGCADDENYACNLSKAVLGLCLPRCHPVANDCPPGCSCLASSWTEGFSCIPNLSQGMGPYGTQCQFANYCDPGLFCGNAELVPDCGGSLCCNHFCDTQDPTVCESLDLECIPWFEKGQAPPAYANVGACAPKH